MTSAEYNAKMNCLKNEKIYKRLIKGINGKDKVICFIRYQLIKSGAFVVDWKIREVIKRKLGVEWYIIYKKVDNQLRWINIESIVLNVI